MKVSLFRNIRFQTYLQIINVIIPLFTTPYIARVLGADMIGIYSSTHSLASFFTLFAMLGVSNYGTRCLSSEKNEENRKKVFIEVYSMQLITCSIATLLYFFYCFFISDSNVIVYIQSIPLFGYFFGVSWYYFGNEDFKTTVVCNLIFRIISVFLLFSLVKSSEDLWKYALIMLGSDFLSQFSLWILMKKNGYIKYCKIKIQDIKKHFLPNFKLFLPLLTLTICTNTDKAMLGTISTYEQTGYYANIERIINVPFSIISGFGTVFLPRMTALYSNNKENAKEFFFITLSGIIMLGVAICCGIIVVADSFIPLFLGKNYEPCIFLIKIFSPIVVIKSLSNAIQMHFLVPFKKENIIIKATATGAIFNIILNVALIPQHSALGAIIATIISEFIILLIQVILTYKRGELKTILKDLCFYIIFGLVMIVLLKTICTSFSKKILNIIFDVLTGAAVYCVLVLIYWNLSKNNLYFTYIKPLISKMVIRLFKRNPEKNKK